MNPNFPKIFFSDLDGTLLTDENKLISPATYEAIRKFVAAGNYFCICTGRPEASALDVQERLGLNLGEKNYVVAYNGGVILESPSGKAVYRNGLEKPLVSKIFALAREYDVYCHTYQGKYILAPFAGDSLAYYTRPVNMPYIINEDPASLLNGPVGKVICVELYDHEKQERFREAVETKFAGKVSVSYSNSYYLEIVPAGINKGTAVTALASYLGIPVENTIGAGDERNDLELLKGAGLGIAMANAVPQVKEAADVITEDDNNHDGLVPYLN